jgi:hypothetical protein
MRWTSRNSRWYGLTSPTRQFKKDREIMQNETFVASAVKVATVNTGAAISMAADHSGTISAIAGGLAAAYSLVQIIKALPWMTDYVVAIRAGLRGNWSHWRSIAQRTEKSGNDNA